VNTKTTAFPKALAKPSRRKCSPAPGDVRHVRRQRLRRQRHVFIPAKSRHRPIPTVICGTSTSNRKPAATREVYEAGLNYVIDGHNAKINVSYQYGDLLSKGLNYRSNATGESVSQMMVGFQWQI
jgi:hypothetical protein